MEIVSENGREKWERIRLLLLIFFLINPKVEQQRIQSLYGIAEAWGYLFPAAA